MERYPSCPTLPRSTAHWRCLWRRIVLATLSKQHREPTWVRCASGPLAALCKTYAFRPLRPRGGEGATRHSGEQIGASKPLKSTVLGWLPTAVDRAHGQAINPNYLTRTT